MTRFYNLAWSTLKAQLVEVGASLLFGLIVMALVWFLIWASWPLCDPLFQWVFDFVEGR